MAINTIKFSEFVDGGDLVPSNTTVGLLNGANTYFNNPWTFLAPGSTDDRPVPSEEMWYRMRLNTDTNSYEYYNNSLSEWVLVESSSDLAQLLALLASHDSGAGASLIGLQTPSTANVQDLADLPFYVTTDSTAVAPNSVVFPLGDYLPLAGGTMSGDIDMDSNKVTNAADPTAPQDYATKFYVDSEISGAGSVTSVAMTVPTFLSVAGSPITTSGTFDVTLSGTALPVTNGGTGVTTSTGTGSVVLNTSPQFITPLLGTPTSGNLANCEGYKAEELTGTVKVINGGTGRDAISANAMLWYDGVGAMEEVVLNDEQLPVKNTGGNIVGKSLVAGAGLTLTPASGSLTFALDVPVSVSNGGTGVTSVTTSPTASSWAGWDANSILSGVNFKSGYSTTVTAAGTTVLTVGSNRQQFFTGTTTQTVTMPVTSTLALGQAWQIVNNSTGVVTIQSSGANTILAMAPSTNSVITCILTSGTDAASWSVDYTNNSGSGGSVTSVAMTVPTFLSVSGSPITTSGTLAVTLSGTALPIANGGTGVTSVTTSPTASAWAGWNANSNFSANNFLSGYATTATAAGTTTLTVSSAGQQYFTGSTTQTVVLPVASTLVLGQKFNITNLSSGVVTVNSSGSNLVQTMAANTNLIVTCILASGTGAASWAVDYTNNSGSGGSVTSVAMTVPTFLSVSGSPITSSGTLAVTLSGTALPVLNGGTGVTTSTGTGSVVLNTSPTLVTPLLGTPTSGNLANCVGYAAANISGVLPIVNGGTAVSALPTVAGASAFAAWNAQSNLPFNNYLAGYATTATAAGTTTLVVGSARLQYFTGSTTQTVVLPVTSTLVLGQAFEIVNNSSGVVTVQSSGANTVQAMAAGSRLTVTCILTSGTTAASWSANYSAIDAGGTVTSVGMTVPSFLSVSGSPVTSSGTLAVTLSGTALPVLNGGTGVTTSTGTTSVVLNTSPNIITPTMTNPVINSGKLTITSAATTPMILAGGPAYGYNAVLTGLEVANQSFNNGNGVAVYFNMGASGINLVSTRLWHRWSNTGTGGTFYIDLGRGGTSTTVDNYLTFTPAGGVNSRIYFGPTTTTGHATVMYGDIIIANSTANTAIYLNSAKAITSLPLTDGQLMIGNTSSDPTAGEIVGEGIDVSYVGGDIVLSATGELVTVLTSTVIGTHLTPNVVYVDNSGSLFSMLLPSTGIIGDWIKIIGLNASSWEVTQAASQYIYQGASTTTVGVTGKLSPVLAKTTVMFTCVEVSGSNTIGWAVDFNSGTLTFT